jgi:hypothetical protein
MILLESFLKAKKSAERSNYICKANALLTAQDFRLFNEPTVAVKIAYSTPVILALGSPNGPDNVANLIKMISEKEYYIVSIVPFEGGDGARHHFVSGHKMIYENNFENSESNPPFVHIKTFVEEAVKFESIEDYFLSLRAHLSPSCHKFVPAKYTPAMN